MERFRGIEARKKVTKMVNLSNRVIKAIESILNSSNDIFIHKSKTIKLQSHLNYINNYLKMHANDECYSLYSKYFDNLEKDLEEAKNLIILLKNPQNFLHTDQYNLKKSFLVIYKAYYSAFLLIHKFDVKYHAEFIEFIYAHTEDVEHIHSLIKNQECDQLSYEISEFLQCKNKSLSISGYKTLSVIKVIDDSIYVMGQSPSGSNLAFHIFQPYTSSSSFSHCVTVVSHVEHSTILKYIDSIRYRPFCIITEPFEYQTLENNSDFDSTEKSILILEIARSIEYLHSRRFVYCCISPSSIYITKEKLPKLFNFRQSQQLSNNISIKLPFGRYSAPEIGIEPISYNEKVDVYSFAILLWELLNNEVPFSGLSEDQIADQVLKQDARPVISQSDSFTEFLVRGWSRNPDLRPSFKEIVQQIEDGQIIFPGTDLDKFKEHVKATKPAHEAALKGYFSLTPQSLLDAASKEIDEYTIELIVNAYLDKSDKALSEAARDIIDRFIKPKQSFSAPELVTLVRIISDFPFLEEIISNKISQNSFRSEFINILFERLPVDISVSFYVQHFLVDESDAKILLEFCISKPEKIQEFAADSVCEKFGDSDVLYQYAQRTNEYSKRSFWMMDSASKEHLIKHFKYIRVFTDISGVAFAPILSNIFWKLDSKILMEYDNLCLLANRLVREGFTGSVIHNIDCSEYALLIIKNVIPTIKEKPIDRLRLIVAVDKFDEVRADLYKIDVFEVIEQNIELKQFEFAGTSLLSLHLTSEILSDHIKFAEHVKDLLLEVDDPYNASGLLTCLVPFSMHLKVSFTQIVPEVIVKLLQMNDTIIASRALSLAVSCVESPLVAKIIASNDVVDSLLRFLGHSTNSFEYIAMRVIARISPYLDGDCNLRALMQRLIDASDTERKAELSLLSISQMPPQIVRENYSYIEKLRENFPRNLNIRNYVVALEVSFNL